MDTDGCQISLFCHTRLPLKGIDGESHKCDNAGEGMIGLGSPP